MTGPRQDWNGNPDLHSVVRDKYKDFPKCNTKLSRRAAYCSNVAGWGTAHVGEGRCHHHGGVPKEQEQPSDAVQAVPELAERVKLLTPQTQEALMAMGTNALVLARAKLIQRLVSDGITTKEVSDLTISLTRLDALLDAKPDEEDPDAKPNTVDAGADEELRKLLSLEGTLEAERNNQQL